MKKTFIGLVGPIGSGKGTFIEILKSLVGTPKVGSLRFSDVLVDALKPWFLPKTRKNLQDIKIWMSKGFGPAILTNAVRQRALTIKTPIVILDGVRWLPDYRMIRSLPNNIIVYITADPRIRYERLLRRNEKQGEKNKTYRQFQAEGRKLNEVLIPSIGKLADFLVDNNGAKKSLRAQVQRFYEKFLV